MLIEIEFINERTVASRTCISSPLQSDEVSDWRYTYDSFRKWLHGASQNGSNERNPICGRRKWLLCNSSTRYLFGTILCFCHFDWRLVQTRFRICRMKMARGRKKRRKEIEKNPTRTARDDTNDNDIGRETFVDEKRQPIHASTSTHHTRTHKQTTGTRLHYLSFYFSARQSRDGRVKGKKRRPNAAEAAAEAQNQAKKKINKWRAKRRNFAQHPATYDWHTLVARLRWRWRRRRPRVSL